MSIHTLTLIVTILEVGSTALALIPLSRGNYTRAIYLMTVAIYLRLVRLL